MTRLLEELNAYVCNYHQIPGADDCTTKNDLKRLTLYMCYSTRFIEVASALTLLRP